MKIITKILISIFIILALITAYFFIGSPPRVNQIKWGVNFSVKYSEQLGLDWQETYLSILDDLGAKNIRISVDWDLIEPEKDKFNFDRVDWLIEQSEKRDVNLILVIGMKTLRWPECHLPEWVKDLSDTEREQRILNLLEEVVVRYKNQQNIVAWQIENEIFFPFGECPAISRDFFAKEIQFVRSLNKLEKNILVTDSGEFSFWFNSAKYGDIVGISMYRNAWFGEFNSSIPYPFTPSFYYKKSRLINRLFDKKIIITEFQAEPWGEKPLYCLDIERQKQLFDVNDFKKHLVFAQNSGFDEIYLWGTEWWYWLKVNQGDDSFWNEAKKLFNT